MTEIVNPYIAGAPVTEQRMFFGREDIFQWVENSIAGQYADHILVVHGQRRVGKTSVLKQLGNRLPKKYIPVFFDLQGRTHTTLDHFLWWLARETVRVLKQDRDIEIPPPQKESFAADPEYFENQFLTSVRTALGKNILLLTFDEFDNLEESEVKEELARPLVDHLRRLMGQPNLNFIFSIGSSGRKLENMQAAYTDFFKTALYKKISFLSEEQTHNLVTRPVEGIIDYERAAVDRIYRITSGHPYFTQLTCHELFARCQRTEQRRIVVADVESVLDDVVERGTVNLKFVWDEATDIEKWGLAGLAQLDKADNRAVADYLRKNRVRFSESDLTSGLLHLREKDVITPQNRFVIYLLRIWLQKNRPIEQTREELTEANPIANRFIEIGLEFRDGGQYDKAIEFFRQALSVSADNIQAQVNIALTYSAQGLLEQAVIEFEKALTLDDEDVTARAGLCEAHLALGDAAMQKGRWKDASKSYLRVLGINEEHTEARQRMAEIARQRAEKALTDGHDEEALSAFADALKYTPEDETLSARVEAIRAEKKAKIVVSLVARSEREAKESNWEGAIRTLEEAVALSPEDSNIQKKLIEARDKHHQQKLTDLRSRAQGLATAEKFNEALKTWQEYLSLKPGAAEQVEEEISRIKKNNELFELYTNAGQAIASRDFDQGIKLLKEVIYRDENYKDASRLLTKAIESRRSVPTQKQSKPRKKPERIQQIRAQGESKTGNRRIWVIGGLVAILALTVAGIFFGTKLWDTISTGIPQTASLTPTEERQTLDGTPIIISEMLPINPILAYIAEIQPDFEEDFSASKEYWNTTQVDETNTIADRVSNGVFKFSDNRDAIADEGFQIKEIQVRDFVLEFDYILNSEDENSHVVVKYHLKENEADVIKFNPNDFGLQGRNDSYPVKIAPDQIYHFQILVLQDQTAIFINDDLIEYSDKATPASGTGIEFVVHAESGFDASLDNIKFWNLDAFDNTLTPSTNEAILAFYEPILAHIDSQSPTFEDDFSTAKAEWGTMVNPSGKWQLITELARKDYSLQVDSELIIPSWDYLNSENFVMNVDWALINTGGSIEFVFRSASDEPAYYEFIYRSGGNWHLFHNDGTMNQQVQSGRFVPVVGSESGYYPKTGDKWSDIPLNNFQFIIHKENLAVFINGELVLEFNELASYGNRWFFQVSGLGSAKMDNFKLWNLNGVSFSVSDTQVSPKDGMVMASIPEGEFTMGSDSGNSNEKPVHPVYLDSFWIDQTEITNRMYALCVSAGVCQTPKALNSYSRSSYYGNSDFDNYPVLYVDWDMANTYCTWAGRRLPTEAEWEKAARGTTGYRYPWGEEADCDKTNFMGCKGETSPVGEYESGKSPYGVFDMAGNVMEWVADWYSNTYYNSSPRENPPGPSLGTYHVLRGGSWKSIENSLRSSYRLGLAPDATNLYLIGFRCALQINP